MVEEAGKRSSVGGLAELRVLMDSLLPRVSSGGRPGVVPRAVQTETQPRQPQHWIAAVAGTEGKREGAQSPVPGNAGMEIRCLNPQTLDLTCRVQEITRRKVDRYYHRGNRTPVEIVRIPKIMRGNLPRTRRSLVLQVEVKTRDWDPDMMPPLDAATFRERPWLPPGKGSRPGEAEA